MMGTKHFSDESSKSYSKTENIGKLIHIQKKDPGMNAEILNVSDSFHHNAQEESSTANISPFLVTKKGETRDKSLIQSPFLVKNQTSQESLQPRPTLFNLDEIFMKSNNYQPIKSYNDKLKAKENNRKDSKHTVSNTASEYSIKRNIRYNKYYSFAS